MNHGIRSICFPSAFYFAICRFITDDNATVSNHTLLIHKDISNILSNIVMDRLLCGIVWMPLFKAHRFMISSCVLYTLVA